MTDSDRQERYVKCTECKATAVTARTRESGITVECDNCEYLYTRQEAHDES